ncbi:ROK family transcriptional regulator [Brachybacterium sp. DNPG3]
MAMTEAVRWGNAAELLRLLRTETSITRREARERLGVSSGTISDLVERLRRARLVSEAPAPASGPGRPSMQLDAHPEGPLIAAVHLRSSRWTLATGDVRARPTPVAGAAFVGRGPEEVLAEIGREVRALQARSGGRVRAVVVGVAGVIAGERIHEVSEYDGWETITLAPLEVALEAALAGEADPALPVLLDNDATLAGIAEARQGDARTDELVLHVLLADGIGGALLLGGDAVRGAASSGGEFGHLPFGDRERRCRCGARGCWGREVDGLALARAAGEAEPRDGEHHLERALQEIADGGADPAHRRALDTIARRFGEGLAGLVNAHAPALVSLGGLAPQLRSLADDALRDGYREGLMTALRDQAPPLVDARFGPEGTVVGAIQRGLDHATSPAELSRWAGSAAPGA